MIPKVSSACMERFIRSSALWMLCRFSNTSWCMELNSALIRTVLFFLFSYIFLYRGSRCSLHRYRILPVCRIDSPSLVSDTPSEISFRLLRLDAPPNRSQNLLSGTDHHDTSHPLSLSCTWGFSWISPWRNHILHPLPDISDKNRIAHGLLFH